MSKKKRNFTALCAENNKTGPHNENNQDIYKRNNTKSYAMKKTFLLTLLLTLCGLSTAWADITTTWTPTTPWVKSGFTAPQGVTDLAGSKTVAMLETPVEVTATPLTVSFKWSGNHCALNMLGVDLVNRTTKEIVKSHYEALTTGGAGNTITYTLSDLTIGDGYMLRFFSWYSGSDKLEESQGNISIVGAIESDFTVPFAPTEGTRYALQESTSGLYLDIQTLGVTEPNQNTNNISLNAKPCIIYFEAGTTDNTKWALKNASGSYVMQASSRNWNAVISTTAYEWTIRESGTTDLYTIARGDGKLINIDTKTAGQPLYCDKDTGMEFKLIPYSDLNRGVYTIKSPFNTVLGTIQSSAALNAITTPTTIVIQNRANNNSYYLAGTSNQVSFEDALLVWEPVTEGVAGKYYLRTTDAENGYFQKTASQADVMLGTKDNAQVFYTTAPTSGGSGATLCDAVSDLVNADTDNLVRFVQEGGTTWLNCQNGTAKPKLGNSGYGVWTVHNVYPVVDATYLSLTQVGDTKASFQATPTKFYMTPSAGAWLIEDKDNSGKYVGSTHDWNTTTDFSLWTILAPDADGYAQIARFTDHTKFLGSDQNANVGTGIFTNVGSGCNSWLFEGAFDCTTTGTDTNGKYHFTSDYIAYAGACNKLRFTLTESGAFYQNGAKRMSFDSFVLYDANGDAVALTANDFTGNNITDFSNMLDGVNGTYCNCAWASGTEDDWFEITLPHGVDLGGAFKFSFVTENTTMNAKAFHIDIKYEEAIYRVTEIIFPDGVNEETITYNGQEEVTVGSEVNANASLFSPNEINGEYVLDFIKDYDNKTVVLIFRKGYYRLAIDAPQEVTVTYDGNPVEADSKIRISTFNSTLFTATDLDDYKWNVVVDEENATITIVYTKTHYTFAIDAPQDVTVTYNGNAVNVGDKFEISTFNAHYFAADEIEGYYWQIVIDEANATATLRYTQGGSVENPQAVVDLVNRIGGAGTDAKFKFVLDPTMSSTQDKFCINAEDGKILIKGNTLSAITTGIGWYLNNIAHINIAWNSLNEKTVAVKDEGAAYADLSNLPLPTAEETHVSDAKYRYYLNTCAFGYSMTSWTWTRWQQEIDWMALHGINMPLQLVGLEEVWRKFLTIEKADGTRKYGFTDEEAKAFVAGPAFIAWWAMNNLEGWGGTAPGTKSGYTNLAGAGGVQDDAWYVRQTELAGKIVEAQRALGMQPVLPGWSGMVPTNFASKSGYATRGNGGNWAGDFVRPLLLSVSNANYAEIAADYYECLHAVMGESQYYSMDPFHEGGGAGTMADYEAMYAAMEAAKPGSQWVIQQWQWSATQAYSLTAVPEGRLIVLDLFSDGSPAFDKYTGYDPQDAVFCAIPNFGGRSGLMGRLQNLTDNYFKFKAQYTSIKGIGAAPEAIEQTPVTYDLIFQLPWMNGVKPDVAEWVNNYAVARYGQDNAVVKEAWSLLRQGPLNYGADGIQGPVEDVWAARPNLDANPASAWGETLNDAGGTYTKARRQMLIDAVYKLLDQEDELALAKGSVYESNYNYDLVEFGGGVMADYAYDLLLGIKEAKNAAGANFATDATYIARRDAFLQLILDMDAFKGTNLNFRLGKWTQEARDAAGEVEDATTATPDWYEYNNARTIVSTWSSPGTNLNDYSYRSWQGLLKDLYYPRWKHYFDNNCTTAEYKFFEWNWAHGMKHEVGDNSISTTALQPGEAGHTDSYTREPEGNTVEKAKEILGKYIIPVSVNGSTYYAYHGLDNDVSSIASIIVTSGQTIDLTPYFGSLTGVSLTSDVVDGTVSDLTQVAIKSDAAKESHTATITLSDATKLTFNFVIDPDYYGVYRINYQNNGDIPVFIKYNTDEDEDDAGNIGYKLIPQSNTYKADSENDKLFTIVPLGNGYSISAQGQYLKQPNLAGWSHVMFSDNKAEAGAYIFEETAELSEIFKIRSTENGINYLNAYNNLVFGNDASTKPNLSTFTITPVTEYTLTVSSACMATLCLPFNVVLPAGMTGYDLIEGDIDGDAEDGNDDGVHVCTMQPIAQAGETLKAGTPVIVAATPGNHNLPITMEDDGAITSLTGSLLCGNYMSQALEQGDTKKKFIFTSKNDVVGFYIMNDEGTIAANKCWMEWTVPAGANVRSLVIRFGNTTDIENVAVAPEHPAQPVIYNLAGQRLETPQRGINIINGRKIVVK